MDKAKNRLLLVDADDGRRESRVRLLSDYGYIVDVRDDYLSAERLNHEGNFDLVIVALHGRPDETIAYSAQLSRSKPLLPILLLTDLGVYVPAGTISRSIETGDPAALIAQIASMLSGSSYIRELPIRPE